MFLPLKLEECVTVKAVLEQGRLSRDAQRPMIQTPQPYFPRPQHQGQNSEAGRNSQAPFEGHEPDESFCAIQTRSFYCEVPDTSIIMSNEKIARRNRLS